MKDVTLVDLLKAGAHFGHKSSRWDPKIKPFIYGHRNNIHIFDLEKTRDKLKDALQVAEDAASEGKVILFVGTKKQARQPVREAAQSAGMPYVVERWLGGTFTNFKTVKKSMKKLERLEKLVESEDIEAYTKKERLLIEREIQKLKRLFEGVQGMEKLPDMIFILSTHHDRIAVEEAKRAGVPVIGVVDSNADLEGVDYVIPGNDDAVQAIKLYTSLMAEAINEGRGAVRGAPSTAKDKEEKARERSKKDEKAQKDASSKKSTKTKKTTAATK